MSRLQNSPAPSANSTTSTSVPVKKVLCLSKARSSSSWYSSAAGKNTQFSGPRGREQVSSREGVVCFFLSLSFIQRIRPLMAPEGHRSKCYGNTRRRRLQPARSAFQVRRSAFAAKSPPKRPSGLRRAFSFIGSANSAVRHCSCPAATAAGRPDHSRLRLRPGPRSGH